MSYREKLLLLGRYNDVTVAINLRSYTGRTHATSVAARSDGPSGLFSTVHHTAVLVTSTAKPIPGLENRTNHPFPDD